MLKPPSSVIAKRKYQEYVDYVEKCVLTKQTEADTSLIIKDSDEFYGKLNIIPEHRQEKREGYNKLYLDGIKVSGAKNGIEYSFNGNEFKLNGTCTEAFDIYALGGWGGTSTNEKRKLKAGDYTLAIIGPSNNNRFNLNMYAGTTPVLSAHQTNIFTKTLQEDLYIANMYLSIYSGKTFNNETFKIMVLEGTYTADTLPPYEPYGVMPSPEYPSEIEAVGDNVQLFDKDNVNKNKRLSTNTGSTYNAEGYNVSEKIEVNSNETYTLTTNISSYCAEYDKDSKFIKGYAKPNASITMSANTKYFRFDCKLDDTIVKFEKGSKATSYSKYGQGSVEISTSTANLFDNRFRIGNIATSSVTNRLFSIQKIKIKSGQKFTVSTNLDLTKFNYSVNLAKEKFPTTRENIIHDPGWLTTEPTTLIATQDCYLGIIVRKKDDSVITTDEIKDYYFQIKLDDETTDYAQHKGETLVMPIQKKMFDGDGFENVDGVWYEKHNMSEYVFTGEEDYTKSTSYSSDEWFCGFITAYTLTNVKEDGRMYCDRFGTIGSYGTILDKDCIRCSNQFHVRVKASMLEANTAEAYKKLLKKLYDEGNPVHVVYQQKTPLLLKCTSEQSKILDKIDTYKDGTIITTDNDLCKISLRYKQDLDKRISELEKQIVGGN